MSAGITGHTATPHGKTIIWPIFTFQELWEEEAIRLDMRRVVDLSFEPEACDCGGGEWSLDMPR